MSSICSPEVVGPEWLTVAEVASHFRVSTRTIHRWAASGEIRSKRIGPGNRVVRIHRSVLDVEHDTFSAEAA
ncbi:helix-turn-helix domain-containing protein [Streptomyces sp. NPDC051064]|uniref:helix-turn-helix domain-containing protein n=1 Tax=Streptomyces sp. NPDC051064 TaxID=3365641 RepID=UPI00378F6872